MNIVRRTGFVVLLFILVIGFALGYWGHIGLGWSYLLSVNLVAFIVFGYDKHLSKKGAVRIPELVLHGVALIGGSLGALGGMVLYRHKTRKMSFFLIWFLIVLLQTALLLGWQFYKGRH